MNLHTIDTNSSVNSSSKRLKVFCEFIVNLPHCGQVAARWNIFASVAEAAADIVNSSEWGEVANIVSSEGDVKHSNEEKGKH